MYIFTASLWLLFLKWVFNIFCSLLVSTVVRRWWHFQQYTVMTYLCLLYLALCHCLHTFLISTLLNIVWCSKILCGELSFLVSLPSELITSWSWDEGTAIPRNHRNHSSSNAMSHPGRLEQFSNTTNITYISSISWPYMIKLAFSNDTEGHFSGSCSGVYKMNYMVIVQPSDGHW